MKEHWKAVESEDYANSALAEHTWSHYHPVDQDKVRVLEQQRHLYHRLTLESIHIRSHPHTLNSNDGTLSPVYNSLFSCQTPPLYPAYCLIPPSQPLKFIQHLLPHLLSLKLMQCLFPCIVAYTKQVTLCFVPPLMKTTAWLSKRLAIIIQFWLVKSGNRSNMSTPSHKRFFSHISIAMA